MPCTLKIGQHLALISKGRLNDALVIRITQQTVGIELGLAGAEATRGKSLFVGLFTSGAVMAGHALKKS